VFSPTSEKYFVVATGEKVVVTFDMKSNGFGQWAIVPPAPEWILKEQTRLSHFIEATIGK
jgi:hypothetical protein